ncbi:bifunctional adenosylcobinamide kinase/adenosylcobinamide-phosphate guanylyltransferase [Antrihabitans cavernicola]|uniref:Adenosylcobinamide kinase n=1 Tax=Antrihabitans cavernicola TaxID=2495913 RepID=A0A5A7SEM7_9NOCA|nr:bifunctional adenosylcobinamide kinase/adenosylcobinamide-phosphate guanylyltransferase [Spelaeibacter cavernicola]KAA0023093.1 bifunctional adenosylcobinamide kinase/adenosylcobinamide-phosphate guanylyltransferase [Spelaeibacter cavernicola]
MPAAAQLRTLVLGGARSGKSGYAERIVDDGGPVRYVATARHDPSDLDFESRIDAHRARRPHSWTLVESADGDLATILGLTGPATLVDDIGTWLTAEIDDADAWDRPRGTVEPRADALVAAIADYRGRLVLVSPEVGLGVIPETRSGRLFRDELGVLNQRIAAVCDEAVFVVAGLPLVLKTKGQP